VAATRSRGGNEKGKSFSIQSINRPKVVDYSMFNRNEFLASLVIARNTS